MILYVKQGYDSKTYIFEVSFIGGNEKCTTGN